MIKLKPCKWIYFPHDYLEFQKVLLLNEGHLLLFLESLQKMMNGKHVDSHKLPIDVVLVLMHVVSFHNQYMEEDEEARKENELWAEYQEKVKLSGSMMM
mgnify:CR=1 FL=1